MVQHEAGSETEESKTYGGKGSLWWRASLIPACQTTGPRKAPLQVDPAEHVSPLLHYGIKLASHLDIAANATVRHLGRPTEWVQCPADLRWLLASAATAN